MTCHNLPVVPARNVTMKFVFSDQVHVMYIQILHATQQLPWHFKDHFQVPGAQTLKMYLVLHFHLAIANHLPVFLPIHDLPAVHVII